MLTQSQVGVLRVDKHLLMNIRTTIPNIQKNRLKDEIIREIREVKEAIGSVK